MKDQTECFEDVLNEISLLDAIGKETQIPRVTVHRVIDSTNAEAKRMLLDGETSPILVVAESQTAGRGRMGRSFYSPDKTGAYFSIAYVAEGAPESAVTITGAASVAVMCAIRRLTGIQTRIKWVNDLYLNDRKVCGILAESILGAWEDGRPRIVIGIGINLHTRSFPKELVGKAGSLEAPKLSRAELIAAVWRELAPMLTSIEDRSWLSDYRTHSTVLGKRVGWIEGEARRVGFAEAIDENGALIVLDETGERVRLFTGEISLFSDGEPIV